MSKKTLKYLFLIFLILLGSSVVLFLPEELISKVRPVKNEANQIYEAFSPDKVTMLRISQGANSVDLTNKSGVWVYGEKKANQESVVNLLNAVKNLKLGDKVSISKENHMNFGVTSEAAYRVEAEVESKKLDVYFGFAAGASDKVYFRKTDSDEVYIGESMIRQYLSVTPTQWRDKNVYSMLPDAITILEISGPTYKKLQIEAGTGKWNVPEDKYSAFTNFLTRLDAVTFPTDSEIEAFNSAYGKYKVQGYASEGISMVLDLEVLKEGDNYLVKNLQTNDYFRVLGTQLGFLFEL